MNFYLLRMAQTFLLALAVSLSVGCQKENKKSEVIPTTRPAALAPLNANQRLADFDFMIESLRAYYAPLNLKQIRFNFNFEKMAQTYRVKVQNAKSDEEALGLCQNFLAFFRDSHLSLTVMNTASEVQGYDLDFEASLMSGRAVIVNPGARPSAAGLRDGDELLSIDGESPLQFLQRLKQYKGKGTESGLQTDLLFAGFRPVTFTDLAPKSAAAIIEVARANQKIKISLPWETALRRTRRLKNSMNGAAEMESLWGPQMVPRFVTNAVIAKYGLTEIEPGNALAANGVSRESVLVSGSPFARAYAYTWRGQRILLLRWPSFSLEDDNNISEAKQLAYLQSILETFYASTDRFVIDLQGNSGGSSNLASDFVSFFSDHPIASETRLINADRKWSLKFLDSALASDKDEAMKKMWLDNSLEVDRAMEAGSRLTSPLRFKKPVYESRFPFKKPVLVLIDGRSVSAAELAAMYFQDHKLGTVMGTRSSGGGGNVEMVLTLPYSQAKLNVTRSLSLRIGSEASPRFIENEGIVPDIPFDPTIEDYRNGFVDAFAKMSEAAMAVGH